MGKIVKFCNSCEESFAEKFSFCPNCANELSAFEMKPVGGNTENVPVAEEPVFRENLMEQTGFADVQDDSDEDILELDAKESIVPNAPVFENSAETIEEPAVFEPIGFTDDISADSADTSDSVEMISDDMREIEVEEPTREQEVFVARNEPEVEPVELGNADVYSEEKAQPVYATNYKDSGSDGFHVTVVSEQGGKFRNGLLLGAFALTICGFLGLLGYSLFSNLDNVASLNDDAQLLALIGDNEPLPIEEEIKKEIAEEGGGGGGGGTNNPKPASKGEPPSQTRVLMPPPQVLPRLDNPSLPVINRTQGDNKKDRTDRVGLTNSLSDEASGGSGTGGGVGTGRGTGVGSGFGTGEGSGSGSGSGSGNGNGNGSGTGDGDNGRNRRVSDPPPAPPPADPPGPTVGIKILSKPKPGYTDEARVNNVRGVVRVKVTFQSNGSVGAVSVVSGLPHGLTDKAIAAAKQIRFEPAQKNGKPQTQVKTVQFNFNIY